MQKVHKKSAKSEGKNERVQIINSASKRMHPSKQNCTYFSLAWASEGAVDPFPFAYMMFSKPSAARFLLLLYFADRAY